MIERAPIATEPGEVGASQGKSQLAWVNWFSKALWVACAALCTVLSVLVISKAKYSGEDSWLPMNRALDFLHRSSPGLVYQKLFFSEHIKFQYPPTGLLI